MNIIIIGCGQVGSTLTGQLSSENHNVTVIDSDAQKVRKVAGNFDVMGVCGNGISIKTLKEAGVEEADILIAVTESDEVNLLCALMAKKVGDCKTIARVRNHVYSGETEFIKEQLELSMIINPDLATASEIAQLVKYPSAQKIDDFANGRIQLVKIKIKPDSVLAGTEVREISSKINVELLVCAVERGEEVIIPYGSTRILAGDTVSFVTSEDKVNDIFKSLSLTYKPIKTAMIVGGDRIAYYTSKMLSDTGVRVKIIENNPTRCEHLDEILPEVTVICGDGTDKTLLTDEGIDSAGAFIATTNIDEENIFLSMFAKEVSNAKLVSKVDRLAFDNIIENLDIGSVVYPNYITADYIMQFVRSRQNSAGNNIATLYRLLGTKVEALEFVVHENSPVIGKPLMELDLKKDLLVCSICRGDKIIIPGGHDTIEKGDSVIIVTLQSGLQDISNILKD